VPRRRCPTAVQDAPHRSANVFRLPLSVSDARGWVRQVFRRDKARRLIHEHLARRGLLEAWWPTAEAAIAQCEGGEPLVPMASGAGPVPARSVVALLSLESFVEGGLDWHNRDELTEPAGASTRSTTIWRCLEVNPRDLSFRSGSTRPVTQQISNDECERHDSGECCARPGQRSRTCKHVANERRRTGRHNPA